MIDSSAFNDDVMVVIAPIPSTKMRGVILLV